MVLGLAVMLIGGSVTLVGFSDLPTRAELTQVSGVVERTAEVGSWHGTAVSHYELDVRSADGEVTKLGFPEHAISQKQFRTVGARPIVVLFSRSIVAQFSRSIVAQFDRNIAARFEREEDVWELSSGSSKIIDYDATRQKRAENLALAAELGPFIATGGLPVLLLGVFLQLRRRWIA